MFNHHRSARPLISGLTVALIGALLIAVIVTAAVALSVLPAAPGAPTPTWPQGIDLPDKLPRLP